MKPKATRPAAISFTGSSIFASCGLFESVLDFVLILGFKVKLERIFALYAFNSCEIGPLKSYRNCATSLRLSILYLMVCLNVILDFWLGIRLVSWNTCMVPLILAVNSYSPGPGKVI